MSNLLKIAITADPFLPVPPENYGGIERIIYFLVEGLANKGHQVRLVAHPESKVTVPLIKYPPAEKGLIGHVRNAWTLSKLRTFKPDVLHSFSRLAYLFPFLPQRIPKIMSYQREPSIQQIKKAVRLSKKNTISFTGCSNYISKQITPYAPSYTVYNGVEIEKFKVNEHVDADAPLTFLGRIEHIKGTHIAIQVALKSKRRLVIAGNIPKEGEKYFNDFVKPFLSEQITYIGPVNDARKNELLGNSAAFLMPVQWNEPFGIVMAEAMACGTPVLGFPYGALNEVIKDGVNGFICTDEEQMAMRIARITELDRRKVAQIVKEKYSSEKIVQDYIDLYHRSISSSQSN